MLLTAKRFCINFKKLNREYIMTKAQIKPGVYVGWEISSADRSRLLGIFPPKFSKVIGHHITFQYGTDDQSAMPELHNVAVVGYVSDNKGIEGLVIAINGDTTRPDGSTYHCTWSLDPDKQYNEKMTYKPVVTNLVLKTNGWLKLNTPINISVTSKVFR
jgi:hypothetical protein